MLKIKHCNTTLWKMGGTSTEQKHRMNSNFPDHPEMRFILILIFLFREKMENFNRRIAILGWINKSLFGLSQQSYVSCEAFTLNTRLSDFSLRPLFICRDVFPPEMETGGNIKWA